MTVRLYRLILNPFRVGGRWKYALGYFYPRLRLVYKWGFRKTETHNYYYEIEELNRTYLINFCSNILNLQFGVIESYFRELENDSDLQNEIVQIWRRKGEFTDSIPAYGRRIAWYAIVRALKPSCVLETGVHQGVGSKVICKALSINAKEGFEGKYFGTDIDPSAGYLLTESDKKIGTILYGDSIESINNFDSSVDIFISDSDHSFEYEYQEYLAVKQKMRSNSLYISDNAHISQQLFKFSQQSELVFHYMNEVPKDHWYPGGGIGVSYPRDSTFLKR